MQNQTRVKKRTETEKQQQSKRVVSTQTDADADGDADGGGNGSGDYQPYCPVCKQLRDVKIDPPDQEDNYYEQDVSIVRCKDCGQMLGHISWWPSRDDSFTGL